MKRREFIGHLIAAGWAVASPELLHALEMQTGLPIEDLRRSLAESDGLILLPQDQDYNTYVPAYNLRTLSKPQVRVLPKTAKGVATAVQWALANKEKVIIATRCGGHSYEGLSQNTSLVIDGRLMKEMEFDPAQRSLTIGSGVLLGEIYQTTGKQNQAIPAGSCPSVGATGHTLGGGYGLLARPLGLACDSLLEAEIVDGNGNFLRASANENQNLYWALRGGGAGSFGAVTQLRFQTHEVGPLQVFGAGWTLPVNKAVALMREWQAWAPTAPANITSIFKVLVGPGGRMILHCMGQSIGSESELRNEMQRLLRVAAPSSPLSVSHKNFLQAVDFFGADGNPTPDYMKGRSNYIYKPMSDQGVATLMQTLQQISTHVAVTCDSYGGAISNLRADQSAFFHREAAQFSMKFSTHWKNSAESPLRLKDMQTLQAAMNPHVSGHSYFNYCDADIKDYGRAYWGDNYERLQQIKAIHDPENIFRHAQSIQMAVAAK